MMVYTYVCFKCNIQFESPKKNKKYCSHLCYGKRFDSVTNTCELCNNEFTVAYRFRKQKTCNAVCAGLLLSKNKRTERIIKHCMHCEKAYETPQWYEDESKYCSSDCFYKHKYERDSKTIVKTCEGCGIQFEKSFILREVKHCSKSCASSGERNAMFGKQGPMLGRLAWNHGKTAKTDDRLRLAGEKISQVVADKMVAGTWSPPSTGFVGEHYTGVKNGGKTVYLRSSYESIYVRMLDSDDDVISWEYEPFRLPYLFEGRTRNYVPDFLITKTSGEKTLIEVKPSLLTETPTNIAKQNAAFEWCKLNNVSFQTVTESTLS